MKGDREKCIAAGMDGYVSKPVQAAALLQAIAQVVPGQRPAAPDSSPPAVADPPAAPEYNREAALAAVGGNSELLGKLARLMFEHSPRMLADIRQAVSDGQGQTLMRAAHKLKGSCGSIRAARAMTLAQKLEELGRAGELGPATALCERLEQELDQVQRVLAPFAGGTPTTTLPPPTMAHA